MVTFLPEEYDALHVFAEILSLNDIPATFILDIQVATKPHLDSGDQTACVVISFRNWIGGGLALHEAGLVLDLKHGDMVTFPLDRLVHFNLHFERVRCSVVLHTVKNGKDWMKDRNGWVSYMVIDD
jgi:hypothetical protein